MKVLIINELTTYGKETEKVCHAKTLRNAFKKASLNSYEYFRIYQVYSNRVPHIIFESVLPKERIAARPTCQIFVSLGKMK